MPQDRRVGGPLLDPVRASQCLLPDRHHGVGTGLRYHTQLLVLEFHWFHRDYWSTITDGGQIIKNGKIAISDRPGIGLELNEEVAKTHQYPGTTWFE